MPAPFDTPFMQRALIEALLLAGLAGVLGSWIVLRRFAFFTHGVGTAAFPGLVVAVPAGVAPQLTGLAAALVYAGGVQLLARTRRVATDAATGLVLVARARARRGPRLRRLRLAGRGRPAAVRQPDRPARPRPVAHRGGTRRSAGARRRAAPRVAGPGLRPRHGPGARHPRRRRRRAAAAGDHRGRGRRARRRRRAARDRGAGDPGGDRAARRAERRIAPGWAPPRSRRSRASPGCGSPTSSTSAPGRRSPCSAAACSRSCWR